MFARFDENPAMNLQDIKETKRYGRTDGLTDGRTDGQRENSIPTTNKVCGGYKYSIHQEWLKKSKNPLPASPTYTVTGVLDGPMPIEL